jgi:hypothetical protein
MPNSKQRLTAKKHKQRSERLKRNRTKSIMEAKKSTLVKLDVLGKLPRSVKEARL